MAKNNYKPSREDKFNRARNDYNYGHGFNSRGLAPAFLGADSLPQAVSDVHWSEHGLAKRIDDLELEVNDINININNDQINEDQIINDIGQLTIGGGEGLNNYSGYLTKVLTTRPRIFADQFDAETYMQANDRLRGFTTNYQWIAYNEDSISCEGKLDKIIDYTFITDTHVEDNSNSRYVYKGQIRLPQLGSMKRIFITQIGNNIVIRYLLSNTIVNGDVTGYTGTIVREEYDFKGNLVNKAHESTAHTPLILLGAFNADSNDDADYIQYISTDYKFIQNYDGNDLIVGPLPSDVIEMIDPVNDLVSDSKVAYIMTYDTKGHLRFPLKGFTLLDVIKDDIYEKPEEEETDTDEPIIDNTGQASLVEGKEYAKLLRKFAIVEFTFDSELMKKFVSITPRVSTKRLKVDKLDQQMWNEGGFYTEVYDSEVDDTTKDYLYPAASHIFYMADSLAWPDTDWFADTMFEYHTDAPSPFSFYRERDYMEFPKITFNSGMRKMYPEIQQDFGIGDVPFTIDFDWSKATEELTIHLVEPFKLMRYLREEGDDTLVGGKAVAVNSRLGYTVTQNSDAVIDAANTNILAVYNKLDFVMPVHKEAHNYVALQPNYNSNAYIHQFVRYQVVSPMANETTGKSIFDSADSVTRLTYFDTRGSQTIDLTSLTGAFINNSNFDEQFGDLVGTATFSPGSKNDFLYNLTNSRFIFTSTDKYKDLPFMYTSAGAYGGTLDHTFMLTNTQDSKGMTQILSVTESNSDNVVSSLMFRRTVRKSGNTVTGVSAWSGTGHVQWVQESGLTTPPSGKTGKDIFQVMNTTGIYHLAEVVTPVTAFPNTSPSTGNTNIGAWAGAYVGTAQPKHAVFANAKGVRFEVYNAKDGLRHVMLIVTDALGKSMAYHNVSKATGKTSDGVNLDATVDNTSGGYTYVLDKWLPGEYVGDDDNPLPPDSNAGDKLIWKWLTMLDSHQTDVKDTESIHMEQEGKWKRPNYNVKDNQGGTYDPSTGKWTYHDDIQVYSASVFISNATVPYKFEDFFLGEQEVTVKNGTEVRPDGVWSPSPLDLIGQLQENLNNAEKKIEASENNITNVTNALSQIINNLTDIGVWDPNATPPEGDINGALKPNYGIAAGNINIFGGTVDGSKWIRTNKGKSDKDITAGIN